MGNLLPARRKKRECLPEMREESVKLTAAPSLSLTPLWLDMGFGACRERIRTHSSFVVRTYIGFPDVGRFLKKVFFPFLFFRFPCPWDCWIEKEGGSLEMVWVTEKCRRKKKFENAQKCFVLISVVTQAFPDFSLQSSNFSAHPRLKLWSWIERSPFFESQEENSFRSWLSPESRQSYPKKWNSNRPFCTCWFPPPTFWVRSVLKQRWLTAISQPVAL